MGTFRDAIDVVPHNFSQSVLKIWNANYDIIVEGLASFGAVRAVDRVTATSVADGFAQLAVDPSRIGTFTFSVADGATSSTDLWALFKSGEQFSMSFTDPNALGFNCSASSMLFTVTPEISRDKEIPMVEWSAIAAYAKIEGGAFTLVS